MQQYVAPLWLAGKGALAGNAQTIWPALASHVHPDRRGQPVNYQRARWTTPDGDFLDVDHLPAAEPRPGRPLLVLFHGLEGSAQSHYSRAFAWWAHARGWDYVVPHFRGCSGELNLAPRTYYSGDHAEIEWILARLAQQHAGPIVAVGISLGGNMLMRWVQEAGAMAAQRVRAAAAVCSPLDLEASAKALSRGLAGHLYTRMFLRSLKDKAMAKLAQHPGLFDAQALQASHNFYTYDNAFTAPVHGFTSTEDYWARCSAKPHLRRIKDVPVLLLNARNDPMVPAWSLPTRGEVGPAVTLWQPHEGGHVGFPAGRFPGHVASLPESVGQWLHQHL